VAKRKKRIAIPEDLKEQYWKDVLLSKEEEYGKIFYKYSDYIEKEQIPSEWVKAFRRLNAERYLALKKHEKAKLFEKISNLNNNEKYLLWASVEKLAFKLAHIHKYRGLDFEDLVQECYIKFSDFHLRFKPEKACFSTFITYEFKASLTHAIGEKARVVRYPSNVAVLVDRDVRQGGDGMQCENLQKPINTPQKKQTNGIFQLMEDLTPLERKVVCMYYGIYDADYKSREMFIPKLYLTGMNLSYTPFKEVVLNVE